MGGLRFFSLDSEISTGDAHEEISSLSDFAVLCRVKDQMRELEKAFHNHSIPYQSVAEVPFFRQEPVRSVLDTLRLAENPRNALLRERLAGTVFQDEEVLDNLPDLTAGKTLPQALEAIIDTHFADFKEKAPHQLKRLLDLARSAGSDRAALFKFLALGSGLDTYQNGLESVALLTLHAAKGLEFRCVFIVGCEEGLLPYSLLDRHSDRDEERRLLYVGMTRAEKYLFLTHARKRFLMGREYRLRRSPFIDRIEEELLQRFELPPPEIKRDDQMKLF